MMKTKNPGRRHMMLFYDRMMDRLWRVTLPLGLLLLAWWYWGGRIFFARLEPPKDIIILTCAVALIVISFIFIFTRHAAYIQAREDHLRLVTPLINLKISYQRVLSLHPAELSQLYPPKEATWAQRSFLEPFYGKTVLALELNKLPMSRGFLRLFFVPQMFLPTTAGFILLVEDWLELSTDLDSRIGNWRQNRGPAKSSFSMYTSKR